MGAEGINLMPNDHVLLADGPAAFAHCVLRLLDDAEESRRLAGNARKLVEEHYDWNLLTPGLAAVYRRIEPGSERLS